MTASFLPRLQMSSLNLAKSLHQKSVRQARFVVGTLAGLALLLAGCHRQSQTAQVERLPLGASETPPTVDVSTALRPIPRSQLPLLIDDAAIDGDWSSLQLALERQRSWLRRRPADRLFTFGPRKLQARQLLSGVELLLKWLDTSPSVDTFAARVARNFDLYESVGSDDRGTMLVTGYFVPQIDASLRRRPGYEVPIYGPPRPMIRVDLGAFSEEWRGRRIAGILEGGRLLPFPDRQKIRTGTRMRGREIAWAADPVDLFFVEVQGSGILRLAEGGERRIGYAGANGRPYRSIGKLLIDQGKVSRERMSMQAIRAYLAAHPDEMHDILDYNPSFVFFRFLEGPPVGNLGVPVTAGRSIAVDQKLMPQGAVGFLITDRPAAAEDGSTIVDGEIRRFVLAQDTGGAIKGAHRADFFWGPGKEAAARAGVMKQPGRLYFLVPRSTSADD